MENNPSYVWRSILATQELLIKGCRKRIRDGMNTSVWGKSWLPNVDSGMVSSVVIPGLEKATVSSLMMVGEFGIKI